MVDLHLRGSVLFRRPPPHGPRRIRMGNAPKENGVEVKLSSCAAASCRLWPVVVRSRQSRSAGISKAQRREQETPVSVSFRKLVDYCSASSASLNCVAMVLAQGWMASTSVNVAE